MSVKLAMLLAAASLAAVPGIKACTVSSISVTKAAAAAKPSDAYAYKATDVQSHFYELGHTAYAKNIATTFSCVDARGDDLYLSTPGGDYSELSTAMYAFFKQTGVKPNATSIAHIFRAFVDRVASPQRPFYFHTDEAKLSSLFSAVYAAGVKPKPVVFPAVQPKDPKVARIWYDYLAKPEYQGCGHVRLMLYKYQDYGLTSPYVPEELIKQFFAYWWPTPLGSPERQRIDFAVKRGPLAGRAVAIVNNAGPACKDMSPLSRAAHSGSSVFVYHQQAVSDFRAKVLGPFFTSMSTQTFFTGKALPFSQAVFVKAVDALQGKQLGFTINNLPPADSVGLFAVTYATKAGTTSNA